MNALLAFGLAAMAYSFALSAGSLTALAPFQALVLVVPALGFMGGRWKLNKRNATLWLIVSVLLLLNLLVNMSNYQSGSASTEFALLHIIGVIGMLFAMQWAATNLDPETVLRYLAVSLLPLIGFAIFVSLNSGGIAARQAPLGIHPNWWGEVAFAFSVSALALRTWAGRCAMIVAALALMALVQSRGAMLATTVAVVSYLFAAFRFHITRRQIIVSGVAALALIVFLAVRDDLLRKVMQVVADDVLLLNDKYRGVGTGLTGRLGGWLRALGVFSENPVLGQGIDTLDEVHNGFLRIAGENGLTLLLVMLAMMGVAVVRAFREQNLLVIAVVLGYAAYSMTYPRMLNMNVAAAVFFMCLFTWRKTAGRISARPQLLPTSSSTWTPEDRSPLT